MYAQSGASLARSDHNLVSVDLVMPLIQDRSLSTDQTPAQQPSLNDRYPLSARSRFRIAPLIQNEHSPKSQCLAQVLGYDMELKPHQVYGEELLKALGPVSSQIADAHKNLQRHNTQLSKVELSAMYASLGAVILQSLNATMGPHKPSNQSGQGIQWRIPPSPQLSALSAVMNQTKHALNRALATKSPDADSLDEEYQVLCSRFAKELVLRQREATATTLARIALKVRDPRAGWLHLQCRL